MAERPAKTRKTADDSSNIDSTSPPSSRQPSPVPEPTQSKPPAPEQSCGVRYSSDYLVTLLVGPDEHKLVVHGHQLSENSDFFKSALKLEWVSDPRRTVNLPKDSNEQVTHYLDFVYSRGLPITSIDSCTDLDAYDPPDKPDYAYQSLFNLYVFGERILDKNFQHVIVREIVRLTSLKDESGGAWIPGYTTIGLVYESTAACSPARRLLVDLQVSIGKSADLDNDLPNDYFQDVAEAFNAKVDAGPNLSVEDFRWKTLDADDYFV